MRNPEYLGDGVYVYFDGRGFQLRLGSHDAPWAVYLEPEVLKALQDFSEALADELEKQ